MRVHEFWQLSAHWHMPTNMTDDTCNKYRYMAILCLLAYRPTLLECSCCCGASGAEGCSGRMRFSIRARTAQSARWKGSSASGSSAGRQQGPARTHSTIARDAENSVACRGNEWRKSVLCTVQWKRTLDERATWRGAGEYHLVLAAPNQLHGTAHEVSAPQQSPRIVWPRARAQHCTQWRARIIANGVQYIPHKSSVLCNINTVLIKDILYGVEVLFNYKLHLYCSYNYSNKNNY